VSEATIALAIIAVVILGVVALGTLSARGIAMDPEQYILGGRSFGVLLLWLLMAGEIYTTFTFLGAAGWAYGKGAPAFYILCYGPLAYIISYYLLPPLWRVAKHYGLLTGPDFFVRRYESRALGVIVAIAGFIFLIPYVTLQLTGLQILLGIAGYGEMSSYWAVALAFMLTAAFVYAAGLRGLAWASVAKDGLVLGAVIFAGVVLPLRFFHSPADVITHVLAVHPHWMDLVAGAGPYGTRWFVSTVLLTALGFFMWPQAMAGAYAAKDAQTLRRNAVFLPFYNVMLLLVVFAGFTALLVMPGLQGPDADRAFMLVVQRHYPAWVLGAVAAAGCLAALIPASGQLLGAASIIVKNVLGDWLQVATSDRARTTATRALVLVVAVLALWFWIVAKRTLVDLLLIGYNGVSQFFPGTVLAFCWRRTTAFGVSAGILSGLGLLAVLAMRGDATVAGFNDGLVALVVNTAACIGASALSRPPAATALDEFAAVAREPERS
jgi:SSS family solute:Na+ symporter